MAKFCTKCGKPLVEGQTCNCGNSETPVVETLNFEQPSMTDFQQANNMNQNMMGQQPQAGMAQPSKANNLFNECLAIVTGFLKKPVTTVQENANENKFTHALIIAGVFAASVMAFVLVVLGDIYAALEKTMTMGGLVEVPELEVPYIKVGLITFIAVAGALALMALIAWLIMSKLFKVNTTYKKVLGIYSISSIIAAVASLAAIICKFIDYRLAFVVLALGFALNTHYVSVTMRTAGQTDENKLGYVVVIAQYVSIFVVAFLLYKIFGEDFVSSMSSMSSLGL